MFGYIKTDIPNMYVKDTVLYRSMYCGLCKSIGCGCGQKARLCLNYDLTFLSVLLHNLCNQDIKLKKQHCIIHPIIKKPIAEPDDLSKRIGALNVLLAYHKLNDDVLDLNKGRIKRRFFNKSYKKALKKEPLINEKILLMYSSLKQYEKQNGSSIDVSADYFANMMVDVVKILVGEFFSEELYQVSYSIGKWIYLIDAIDDYDKDKKNGNYNVFVLAYNSSDKKSLINEHGEEISFIFESILEVIADYSKKLKYHFNHDLTDNIMLLGLKAQTKKIMEKK